MKRAALVVMGASLSLLCLAGACGGGRAPARHVSVAAVLPGPAENVGPASARGDDVVSAHVGPDGGTLELASGARLEIPDGAFTESTEVTLRRGPSTQAVGSREGEARVGPVLQVTPAFAVPAGKHITVSIPLADVPSGYQASDLAVATEESPTERRALGMGGEQTHWVVGPATWSGGRLRAELTELSGMRVLFVASP